METPEYLPQARQARDTPVNRTSIYLAFWGIGSLTQLLQILLVRELLVVFSGNEISMAFFYGCWLGWIGLGSVLAAVLEPYYRRHSATVFLSTLLLLPLSAAGCIGVARILRWLLGVSPVTMASLSSLLLAALLVSMPLGLISGLLFPLGCKLLGHHRAVSRVYAYEALGSLAAGLLSTFWLLPYVRPGSMIWGSTLLITLLVLGAARRRPYLSAAAGLLLLTSSTLLLAGTPLAMQTRQWRWRSRHPQLEQLASFDTPYQHISVARWRDQISLLGQGQIFTSFPDRAAAARLAALIISQQPRARRILFMGGAFSPLLPALLLYPLEHIDVVEQDPYALACLKPYLPPRMRQALANPKTHFHFQDGRHYVHQKARSTPGYYDLIISLLPDPQAAYLNRYYTLEYYQDLRRLLTAHGVFITKVTINANYLGPALKSYAASIYKTMQAVWPAVAVTPSYFFLASNSARQICVAPLVLAGRYRRLPVRCQVLAPENFTSLLDEKRSRWLEQNLQASTAPLNSDQRPVSYYFNIILREKKQDSALANLLQTLYQHGDHYLLIILVVLAGSRLVFLLLHPAGAPRYHYHAVSVVAVVGASAMALQILLLFAFQNHYGFVFSQIGLLNGLFMAGLGTGALLGQMIRCAVVVLVNLGLLSLAALAASLPWLLPQAPVPLFALLVSLVGLLTGTLFSICVSLYARTDSSVSWLAAMLDSADHWGGALGGILVGGFVLPLAGSTATSLLLSAILSLQALWFMLSLLASRCHWPGLRQRALASFPCQRLSWFLFTSALVIWWATCSTRPAAPAFTGRYQQAELATVYPAARYEFHPQPYPHYKAYDQQGHLQAIVLGTQRKDVHGYGNAPLHLLLALSPMGKLLGVRLISSQETPAYIVGLEQWMRSQLLERNAAELHLGADGVQAITGATITSQAVITSIRKTCQEVGRDLLHLQHATSPGKPVLGSHDQLALMALGSLMLLALCAYQRGWRRWRVAVLVGTILISGFWLNRLWTLVDIANLSQGQLALQPLAYLTLGFILVSGLLWGPLFCGFICPFGALQELCSLVGERAGLLTPAPSSSEWRARYLKYVLLWAGLVLFWLSGYWCWITFNPMQLCFKVPSLLSDPLLFCSVAVIMLGSVFYFRLWCRYFCPVGALLGLFNKLALANRWAPRRHFRFCTLGVKTPFDVDCLRCQRCLATDQQPDQSAH